MWCSLVPKIRIFQVVQWDSVNRHIELDRRLQKLTRQISLSLWSGPTILPPPETPWFLINSYYSGRGLFFKWDIYLKPQIGLYARPFLQESLYKFGKKVFNKDLFEDLNENLIYETALIVQGHRGGFGVMMMVMPKLWNLDRIRSMMTSRRVDLVGSAAAVERYWLKGEVIPVSTRLSPLRQVSLEGCELLGWVQGMSLHVWGKKKILNSKQFLVEKFQTRPCSQTAAQCKGRRRGYFRFSETYLNFSMFVSNQRHEKKRVRML